MLEVIEQVAKDEAFDLEKFDITSDESIFEKYKNEIPVLTINGRKAFKARATAAELKKKIGKARELASKLAADDEPMLELTDVTKYYGALAAVRDVSFAARPGEVLG